MAKAKTDSATVVASAAGSERPTPENTPLPGGGSWRWDDDACCWVPSETAQPEPLQSQPTPASE